MKSAEAVYANAWCYSLLDPNHCCSDATEILLERDDKEIPILQPLLR